MKIQEFQQIALSNRDAAGLTIGKVQLVLAKIDMSGDCWIWTASRKENGYGQFNLGRKNWNAHRLVYLLSGGKIPDDFELDHLCRVRECVNPEHLEPVTRQVNVRRQFDMITHCPLGHQYSEDNTYMWRGLRHCRTCRAIRNAERKQKLRQS